MARWLTIALLCIGCGSGNPTGEEIETPSTSTGSLVYIEMAELDAYVDRVQEAFGSVGVMIDEFSTLSGELRGGTVSTYWIRQHTQNLLTRVDLMIEHAGAIRPENPELLRLHKEEYESALNSFREAFGAFLYNIELLSPTVVDQMNDRIVEGNTHLIRLQIFLSDLTGRYISFLEQEV